MFIFTIHRLAVLFRHPFVILKNLYFIFLSFNVFGQGMEEGPDYTLSFLGDVTLQKVATHPNNIPSSVTVITADQIYAFQYKTLGEIIASVSGCFVSKDPIFDQLVFRGIGTPYDYNTRVLILIDGHPLNESVGNSALDATGRFLIPIEAIEQVEIMKGPDSAIYGTSACMGVINVKTKNPESPFYRTLFEAGTRDNQLYSLSAGHRFENEGELIFFSSGYEACKDEYYFKNKNMDPPERKWDDALTRTQHYYLKYKIRDWTLTCAAADFFYRFGGGNGYSVFSSDDNYQKELRGFVDLSYDKEITEFETLKVRLFYDDYDYEDSFDFRPEVWQWYDEILSRSLGAEVLCVSKRLNKNRMTLGCEILNADTEIENGEKSPAKLKWADIEKEFYVLKVFLNNEYVFSDSFYGSCGVHYNQHELLDKNFAYYAGLGYMPCSDHLFKISARQGFRIPTLYEAYYQDNVYILNNPDLKSERVNSYEIIYQQSVFDGFKMTCSVYYSEFRDFIIDSEEFNENTQMIEQYSNSWFFSTQGIEVNLEHRSPGGQETSLSCAWQDDRKNDLINFPEYLVNLTHSHSLLENLDLQGLFHYISPRKTRDPDQETSEFCTVDLVLIARYNENLSFSISGKNLLKDEYETPLGEAYDALTFSGRARTWTVSVKSRF